MSESGVGYLDVILDISILCYSFRFKMQWLAVIVNAINLMTPGREEDTGVAENGEVGTVPTGDNRFATLANQLYQALGGAANVVSIDN